MQDNKKRLLEKELQKVESRLANTSGVKARHKLMQRKQEIKDELRKKK